VLLLEVMESVVDVKNAVMEVTSETGKVRLLNGGMCAIPTPPFQIPLVVDSKLYS